MRRVRESVKNRKRSALQLAVDSQVENAHVEFKLHIPSRSPQRQGIQLIIAAVMQ